MRFKLLTFLTLTGALVILSTSFFTRKAAEPKNCLSSSTLDQLILCFDKFTVPPDTYDWHSYTVAQPSPTELESWRKTVTSMLFVDDNCTSVIPVGIARDYTVSLFHESVPGGKSFCILSESHSTTKHYYNRGWGIFAVPAKRPISLRNIHFSAPHPMSDFNTPQQAAALFKLTNARSLLITGRHRDAYLATSCEGAAYHKTDAAHDTREPFHEAMVVIRQWQNAGAGCPSETCAYIQMHGKGPRTCPADTTFMSAGVRVVPTDPCSLDFYTSRNYPVQRLRKHLSIVFPAWTNSLPSTSTCRLTAADNIFGRLVNTPPSTSDDDVCTNPTICEYATGQFVHVEQAALARNSASYTGWAKAILNAFPPI